MSAFESYSANQLSKGSGGGAADSSSNSNINSNGGGGSNSSSAANRDLYGEGWERRGKHLFVLSSSGKPIFSRYGDEQEMSTTFGLLQVRVDAVVGGGGGLRCIRAGSRRIVFFTRGSLYFVCVSSSDEPEAGECMCVCVC
eukprot:GSChrysophyteH2.ASY1.ANO1.9.1 assembled CDS